MFNEHKLILIYIYNFECKDKSAMSHIMNSDCTEIIVKFLDPKDIVNLCHIFPKFWARLYPQFKVGVARKIDRWFRDRKSVV